jgi:hypothetical protein
MADGGSGGPAGAMRGLGRPEKFSGKETEWSDWKFTFLSYMSCYDVSIATEMRQSASSQIALPWSDLPEEVQ